MSTSREVSQNKGTASALANAGGQTAPGPIQIRMRQKNEQQVTKSATLILATEKQSPVRLPVLPELDSGVQVIGGSDAAFNLMAETLRPGGRRRSIRIHDPKRGELVIDISQVQSVEHLNLLMESLPSLAAKPEIKNLFLPPAFGLVSERERSPMRSHFGPVQAPDEVKKLTPLDETRQEEVRDLESKRTDGPARRASFGGYAGKRAYLAMVMQEERLLLNGLEPVGMTWGQMEHADLMRWLRDGMAKLSQAHQGGHEAGDTSVRNTVVARGHRFFLKSIGHLQPLDRRTQGLPEVRSLLASFAHDLSAADLQELLGVYLQASVGAEGRAEAYLRHRHETSARTQRRPYAPHTPLVDRLVGSVEDLVDPILHEDAADERALKSIPGFEDHSYLPSAWRKAA